MRARSRTTSRQTAGRIHPQCTARSSEARCIPRRIPARSPTGSRRIIQAFSSADRRFTACSDRYHANVSSSGGSDSAAVDPPIPVPDVPGADASARGLPRRVDLTLRQRADRRFVGRGRRRAAHRDRVAARGHDGAGGAQYRAATVRAARRTRPSAVLRRTGQCAGSRTALSGAGVRARISSRPANPIAEWMAKGSVHNIRFDSSFQAVNPALREQCSGYARNNVVRAQHWRHDDGPHPRLCVIHGFMGSPYLFNGLFFSLPWFYRSGYDVLLYTLPFHGSRAEKGSLFSGYGFFAHGFAGFAEAMAQAVHDFRSVIDYLEFTGVDRVALTGMSLGGYTSALIACVDDRIQAVIPNVPVVAPDRTIDEWFPANYVVHCASSSPA